MSGNESSPDPTEDNKQVDTTQEVLSADSSVDSGGSSDSPGSESGSSSSSTGSGTSVTDESDGSASETESIVDQSTEAIDRSSDQDATFNSAVGGLSQSDQVQSPAFATPSSLAPVKQVSVSPSVEGEQAASPVIATPAKNLVFEATDDRGAAKIEATLSASSSAGVAPPTVQSASRSALAPHIASAPAVEQPGSVKASESSTSKTQKGKVKPVVGHDVVESAQHDQPSDKKRRKSNKKDQEQEKKVPKVPKVPKSLVTEKRKKRPVTPPKVKPAKPAKVAEPANSVRKRRKKSRKSKSAKKAKIADPKSSTNESQSADSSSDVPTTSSRIGRISHGKRYQKLAMSKAKRLGNTVDGSLPPLVISKALKVVKSAQYNIQPEHAFRDYHRVFGTQLPHIQNLFVDIQTRYNSVLAETSELELNLAHQHDMNRVALIKPEAESSYTTLWQFQNDMKRAAPSESESSIVDAAVASTSKAALEIDFNDLPALRGTPARKELAKEFNEASAFADRSKKGTKDPMSGVRTKEPKKRKKHRS